MRTVLISAALLLYGAPIFAQGTPAEVNVNSPAATKSSQPMVGQHGIPVSSSSPAAAEVAPDAPVVRLDGVCDQPRVPVTKSCKTVLTRAQIDRLTDVLTPGTPSDARRTFTVTYARMLAASAEAQRQHLEKDPAVAAELQEELKIVRMRVLTNALYRQMEEHANNVPASEIQKYYTDHKANFEEGEVRRLSIPRSALESGKQFLALDASDVKARMDDIVARATAGEDFDQIQQEAYTMFGIVTPPPPVKATMMRRTNLRAEEAKVFDLKAGEVTQMLNSPDGFVILKLESKHIVPIEVAQLEFKAYLQRDRKVRELQSAAKSVAADFNLAYLGLSAAPELFPPQSPVLPTASKATAGEAHARAPIRRRVPTITPGVTGLSPSL